MKTEEIEARIRRTKRLDMNMIADNPPPEFSIYLQELLEGEVCEAVDADQGAECRP